MNFRSPRGSRSSSSDFWLGRRLGAGLILLVAVGCSLDENDPSGDDDAGDAGTTSVSGQGGKGGASTGGQAGTQASGGKAGAGGSAGGVAAQGGTGPGGSGASASGGGSGFATGGDEGTGTAGDAGNGGSSAGDGSGGTAGGGSTTPGVHYVGRVNASNPDAVRFAWSGTGAVVRFNGTSVSVNLSGGQEYTVVVDGQVQAKLTAMNGMNVLAGGLAAGEHTVELYRRTEASEGESEIRGFDFAGGELLSPPPVTRRLEFIGDSITCGYGIEGENMNCSFTPQTANHYLTYAALTARNLQAELSTVAWSGKGVVCNYGDDASSCSNPLPTYYDRILPNDAGSAWDFSEFQPDAVVINLGTNDFSTSSDPDQPTFEGAYRDLLERVRDAYPNAHILCTNGPMLSGTDLSTVRLYLENVVEELDDPKISTFQLEAQDGSDGYGCDWHPSRARHEKLAIVVTSALETALGW